MIPARAPVKPVTLSVTKIPVNLPAQQPSAAPVKPVTLSVIKIPVYLHVVVLKPALTPVKLVVVPAIPVTLCATKTPVRLHVGAHKIA
jgi:hypothetical protein